MPRVLNGHGYKRDWPQNAIYVGRPSKWGNPFVVTQHGARDQVVEMYEIWIKDQPQLLQSLHELTGKDLVCWCAPHPCHAEVLLKLANAPSLTEAYH